MPFEPARLGRHQVDPVVAEALTFVTSPLGVVYVIASSNLPQQSRPMEGVTSCYPSAYTTGFPTLGVFSAKGYLAPSELQCADK